MSKAIYYFSATGNCLTTANLIAKHWDKDCDVIPCISLKDETSIDVPYDEVGFVFPIYYVDMPYLVRDVIQHMNFKKEPYIFLLATYRGHPGDVAKRLDDLLKSRGVSLSLSTGVTMPGNSFLSTKEENVERIAKQEENIIQELKRIQAKETHDYGQLDPVEESVIAKGPHNMRGIIADDKCIGCGICARVCPMENIHIENGHAIIGDQCLTCLACFHWCPQEAIHMSKEKDIEYRFKYHHPDVTLKDILNQKKKSA